ncbi:trypsin-like peptidase domain-containing protein [Candidatus Uhrbacteria bacterium]|nr:trypsin-like peptidase domain-containing protein [Candidatus Uhrbacteria bacterium]
MQQFHEIKRRLFQRIVGSAVYVAVTDAEGKTWEAAGFIAAKNGYVVTAQHVIANGTSIMVRRLHLPEKSWAPEVLSSHPAELIDANKVADLALLKLRDPPEDLRPVRLADSNRLLLHDTVYRVGNDATGPKLAVGPITAFSWHELLPEFTSSMAAEYGTSGGPLFNVKGRLIGMAQRVSCHSRDADALYAIPSNAIRNFLLAPAGLRRPQAIMGSWWEPQRAVR